jgi:hypothetical protein
MKLIELNLALENHYTVCAMATFWPQGVPTLRKALRNKKNPKSMVCTPIDRELN